MIVLYACVNKMNNIMRIPEKGVVNKLFKFRK